MIDLAILTAAEAADRLRSMGMRISPEILREGIEQGVFPFGSVIRSKKDTPRCFIYKKKLDQWAREAGYDETI